MIAQRASASICAPTGAPTAYWTSLRAVARRCCWCCRCPPASSVETSRETGVVVRQSACQQACQVPGNGRSRRLTVATRECMDRVPRVVTLEPCQPGRRRAAFGRFGVGGCRIPTGRCWGPLHARGFEQPCSVAAITALRFSNSHNILAVTSASVGPGHRAARVATFSVLCASRPPRVSVSRCASG